MRYILRVAGDVPFETVRDKLVEVTPAIEAAMASPAEQLIQRGLEEGLQKGREKGLEEGLQKGLQKGLAQGNRETLARQLEIRFGALDEARTARIATASSAQLEHWLDRVVTAETLDDVFAL